MRLKLYSLGVLLAVLVGAWPFLLPAPAAAQTSCDDVTYISITTYAAGGSYSITVPSDVICVRFNPSNGDTYYVDHLGLGLSPYSGAVNLPVDPGLPVALLTGTGMVEVLYGFIPLPTATPAPTEAPTATPAGCTVVSSTVIGSHNQIVFPESGTNLLDADVFGWSVRSLDEAFDLIYYSGAGATGSTTIYAIDSTSFEVLPFHSGSIAMNSYIPFGGQPFSVEYCPFSLATPTPTGSPTPTATRTPTVTPTRTATAAPGTMPSGYTNCTAYVAGDVGGLYSLTITGDLFGAYVRVLWDFPEGSYISATGRSTGGASLGAPFGTSNPYPIGAHTVYMTFTGFTTADTSNQFSVQVCRLAVTPTATPGLFATRTPTRTPTASPTGAAATATPTAIPTLTPIPGCSPVVIGEMEADCEIWKLQQTQVALLQTQAAVNVTPAVPVQRATSVPDMEGAIAAACTDREPCAIVTETFGTLSTAVEYFQTFASQPPDCSSLPWPDINLLSGHIDGSGFGFRFCWFISVTTELRNLLRMLSVIVFAWMTLMYIKRLWHHMTDR